MPQVNTNALHHVAPRPLRGWQWLPFTNVVYLQRLQHAIGVIDLRIRGHVPCDKAFQALPGGRTFAQVWTDPAVWISYDPTDKVRRFGATLGREVTLSQYTCRMGVWTIVATLIHELAHVNGAGGGHDAEGTLQQCLMRAHHDPKIMGELRRTPRDEMLTQLNRSRFRPVVG